MKPGNKNSYKSLKTINISEKNYKYYSLVEAEKNGLKDISKLPKSIKLPLSSTSMGYFSTIRVSFVSGTTICFSSNGASEGLKLSIANLFFSIRLKSILVTLSNWAPVGILSIRAVSSSFSSFHSFSMDGNLFCI